jgi:formate hydrogenlyase subunit 6/NADH:ubiquinone oxidoreductase subunit I
MGYFKNIWEAVSSIAKGMGVTLRTFFTRVETIQYPDVDVLDPALPGYHGHLAPVSERYRGFLTLKPDACITCSLCAQACPVDCIKIESVKGPRSAAKSLREEKDSPKTRYATQFDIHLGRCMYCGLCVEACPQGGIYFSREFRGATEDYGQMIRHFIPRQEAERLQKMAAEEAAKPKEPKPEKKAEPAGTKEAAEKKA